jgi:predicted nucleotidyltransferase
MDEERGSNKEKVLACAAEKLGVGLILLFGSRADGSNRKDSDFDIAYRAKKGTDGNLFKPVFNALMAYTGSDNLHILNLREVKPLTLYEIMRNCKVLYAENMLDFYNLRAAAFRRFEDEVKPLYEIIFNRLKKQYRVSTPKT